MMKEQWQCTTCGGTNVEHVVHLWQDPNTEEFGDVAGGWNGESYCNDCCDECGLEPVQVEVDEPDPFPHYARITFGLDCPDGVDLDPDDVIQEVYRFATEAELSAFMLGIEEGVGWLGHRVEEDSRDE